jgi:hypothetical protein
MLERRVIALIACRHEHDAHSPDVFLSTVPIRDGYLQARLIGAVHLNRDPSRMHGPYVHPNRT